jgi:hypothetical protein
MIGLARSAQLAGWNSGSPVLRIKTGLDTSMALNNIHVTRPLYTVDFSDTTGQSFVNTFNANNDTIDFSDTSSTDGRFSVASYTLRIGSDFLPAANSYAPGFTASANWAFPGGQDFRAFGVFRDDFSNYLFNAQANAVALSPTEFNSIRNRWITMQVATTTDPENDFVNFNGGEDFGETGWAQRVLLADLESGAVIKISDGWAFRSGEGIDLSETWKWFNNDRTFQFVFNISADSENAQNIQFAAAWYAIGDVLDPAQHWQSISGTGAAATVEGVTALFNLRLVDTNYITLNNVNNDPRGYSFDATLAGGRFPAGTRVETAIPFFQDPAGPVPALTTY